MIVLDEVLVEKIKTDTAGVVVDICREVLHEVKQGTSWSIKDYTRLSEVYAFLEAAQEAKILTVDIPAPKILDAGDRNALCSAVQAWLNELYSFYRYVIDQDKVESSRNHFKSMFGTIFSYEFSRGDVERVQILINELRENISQADLESGHKQRLLSRLEKLQSELHKNISDLDRFWGLIGDAGVVMGKLGTDAKPIVDRIKEVADIVWRTQSRAEELPSGTEFPLLEDKSQD